MNDADFHWLCGLLEGEGSFMKGPPSCPQYPVISMCCTDEDVIQRVASLFGVAYCKVKKRQDHWKQSFIIRIHAKKAVDLMLRMRPYMSQLRQGQIDVAVASYESRPNRGASKLTNEQVRSVKRLIKEKRTIRFIAATCNVSTWSVLRIKNHDTFPDVQV